MSNYVLHSFHLVDESPWPLVASVFGLGLTSGLLKFFYFNDLSLLFISALGMGFLMSQWWRDVAREGSKQGIHSQIVELGLRWGMALFIVSEVFFFLSFFWAFFHGSLGPSIETGGAWPPLGIKCFNPLGVPLLNSIVLLTSGASVTWSHHAAQNNMYSSMVFSLSLTVGLGLYFTCLQGMEYWEASFSISDGKYGSTFFLATGFHGLHVIVGSIFLLVTLIRVKGGELSPAHHFGFEAAAWYWHFVDVVWLFLYISVYWWGAIN